MEELENLANNLERQWEPQINLYVSVVQPRERLYRALAHFYPAAAVAASTCTSGSTATSMRCRREI